MEKKPRGTASRHGDLILLLFVLTSMGLVVLEILGNLIAHVGGR